MNKLEFYNNGKNIDIKIYGDIGEDMWGADESEPNKVNNLDDLSKRLKENPDAATIDVYINSNGGSIFDGIAIYNVLKRHRAYKRVFIDGFACSIASVIAMAGNKIVMPKTSMMMIHNAWTVVMGNAKELRKMADDLDKINETIKNAYLSKSNLPVEEITRLMDEETYLSAEECFEYGFCTAIDDTLDVTEKVNEGLDKMDGLYQNKLNALNALKNAIKEIEAEEEIEVSEAETETETGETEEVIEPVEETGEPEEVKEAEEAIEVEPEADKEVKNIKENALKAFFNFKEEDK